MTLKDALIDTDFNFPGQVDLYKGKVRDVYNIRNNYLVMIASDRISAFDCILPEPIPYKGQVLNQLAFRFLEATRDIVPNWTLSSPDPNVTIGYHCDPYMVEMVIRGYLTGHAWRVYKSGKREICGIAMPDGLKEHDRLPAPIITPTTKAMEGHDEDISREEIIAQGLVRENEYVELENYTRALFQRGTQMAADQGLILVDTKYEFGRRNGQIYLIDEVHTPDSSRYFYAEGYDARQANDEGQKQLSKEFVREWLIEHNFQGLDGQIMPEIPAAFVEQVSNRYIELYEKITGVDFIKADPDSIHARIEQNVMAALNELDS